MQLPGGKGSRGLGIFPKFNFFYGFPYLHKIYSIYSGTGGYLSTYQPKGIGFVNYIKKRLLGADSTFCNDTTYLMFMFLLKETVELKRSRVTFFRKAKMHYKGKTEFLKEAGRDEIERTDVGFKGIIFSILNMLHYYIDIFSL